jgi:hypothetical protein
MALIHSTAAVSQAVWAARNALGVLEELLATAKFQDDQLRSDVKQFLENAEALQARLDMPECAGVYDGEDREILHAKLLEAMALCGGTLDQLSSHARESGKAKSGLFRPSRRLSAKDDVVIRSKQRLPVHINTVQLTNRILHV